MKGKWKKMAKHKAQAPNFKERGGIKEFISEDGRTYLILKFPDWSILVLQKIIGVLVLPSLARADFSPEVEGESTSAKGDEVLRKMCQFRGINEVFRLF